MTEALRLCGMVGRMQLKPGSVVVFEGLDATGKSTQLDRLGARSWDEPAPMFVHMPSGLTTITSQIYQLTETAKLQTPLGRQLLHLSCHAENMEALLAARDRGGLVLDRWWWSTVAYGWYGGGLHETVPTEVFRGVIDAVWSAVVPEVVFAFLEPFNDDPWNLPEVRAGYEALVAEHLDAAVRVPQASPDQVAAFIEGELRTRGIMTD